MVVGSQRRSAWRWSVYLSGVHVTTMLVFDSLSLPQVTSRPVVEETYGPRKGLNPPTYLCASASSSSPRRGHRAQRKKVSHAKGAPLTPQS